jgi:hypothetical protein
MIILKFNKLPQKEIFKEGSVVHLKILNVTSGSSHGSYDSTILVEDVTPLPGAEPTGYACHMCGIIEEAKPDGSLPDGWGVKKYEEGSGWVCSNMNCQNALMCRICGCTRDFPCHPDTGPCFWIKPDPCSACVDKPMGRL